MTGPDYPAIVAILADAINLDRTKMAPSGPGATDAKLSWLRTWHIRDKTYLTGLADLINAKFKNTFAENWGDGTTSSSDGQRFRTSGWAAGKGHINPKYGADPGKLVYPRISPRSAPRWSTSAFAIRPLCWTACHTLNRICASRMHSTDTDGVTDHVFADVPTRLVLRAAHSRPWRHQATRSWQGGRSPDAAVIIGANLIIKHLRSHWDDVLRLAASIKLGTVTACLVLRKPGSYCARTVWQSHCASWAASRRRCASGSGTKTADFAGACTPG